MKQTIRYQRASILRRICSSIFDLIILVIVFVCFDSFIVSPIVNAVTDYNKLNEKYNTMNVDTHLVYVDNTSGSDVLKLINYNHDTYLVEFYNDNTLGYTMSDYNKLKEEATITYNDNEYYLFSFDEESGTYIDATSSNETINTELTNGRTTFYTNLVVKLYDEVFAADTELSSLSRKLVGYKYISWTISLVFSSCITFLMFPLIFKDRATLGKKMFRFQVVNDANGAIISRFQAFARFVYFEVLYVAMIGFFGMVFSLSFGLIMFIGLSLISVIMVFVSKKRQTLHDMLSHSIVVRVDMNASLENKNEIIEITYDDGKPEEEIPEASVNE